MTYKNIEQLLTKNLPEHHIPVTVPDYLDDDILYISQLEKMPQVYTPSVAVNILFFCKSGSMEMDINGVHYSVKEADVLVCPSNVVITNVLISPGYKFVILAFTDRLVQELLRNNMDVWNRAMYIRKAHVVSAANESAKDLHRKGGWHFTELMRLLLKNRTLPMRREIAHSLVNTILLTYCSVQRKREMKEDHAPAPTHTLHGSVIFNRFMQMLNNEEHKYQPVKAYAARLFITPKHLSFVCKKVSGKNASELIQVAVTEEIVRMLHDPTISVKEIAWRMGFDSLSFFGKYVKNRLGVAPNVYRRRLE